MCIFTCVNSLRQCGHLTFGLIIALSCVDDVDDSVLLLISIAKRLPLYFFSCSCLVSIRVASLTEITCSMVLASFLVGFVYFLVTLSSLSALIVFCSALFPYRFVLNEEGTYCELFVPLYPLFRCFMR